MLAWLEKQGEHKRFRDSIQIGDSVTKNEYDELVNLSQLNRVAKRDADILKKQSEQKSTTIDVDKMVSDYASHNEKRNEIFGKPVPCMVRAYKQGICDTLESLGEEKPFEKEFTFKAIPRLLDMIEPSDRAKAYCQKLIDTLAKEEYNTDAKIVEGVLKGWNGEDVPMAVMDEKQSEQKPADKVGPKFKVKYAGSEYNVFETKDIAGVTFYGIEDEPNHIDYVKAENCEIISGYAIKENGSPYPTKPAVFSEQKSAWSEEDEKTLNEIFSVAARASLRKNTLFGKSYDYIKWQNWLKSLRDRVQQPKHEWSEEDKDMIRYIGNALTCNESAKYLEEKGIDMIKAHCWLESFKPQKQWKPSDEQMNALDSTLQYSQVSHNSYEHLNSLYNDLKKLTE